MHPSPTDRILLHRFLTVFIFVAPIAEKGKSFSIFRVPFASRSRRVLTSDQMARSFGNAGQNRYIYLGGLLYPCAIVGLVHGLIPFLTKPQGEQNTEQSAVIFDRPHFLVSRHVGLSLADLTHNLLTRPHRKVGVFPTLQHGATILLIIRRR